MADPLRPLMRWFVGLALLAWACPVMAQEAGSEDGAPADEEPAAPPSPEEIAAAREAFGRGQQAFNTGDYAGAASAYEEAYAVVPDPTILFSLGDARQRAEDYRGAVEAYQEYIAKRPEAENRADVEARIDQLMEVPGTINVVSDPPGASISIDGVQLEDVTPAAIPAGPGQHIISVSLPDYAPGFQEVDVEFDSEVDVSITLEPAPEEATDEVGAGGAAVGAGAAVGDGGGDDETFHPGVGTWVTIGIAGAALATGTVLGFLAMDRQSDFDDSPGTDSGDEGDGFALGADIAFGVSLAAGITAVVLYVVERNAHDAETAETDEGATVSVTPVVGPQGGGVAANVRF